MNELPFEANKLTFDMEVKLHLVALAEYLQSPPLSDIQIKLYASELVELGPEGLTRAISLLKEDPDLYPGRVPLPAKIKQYVSGDINSIAIASANKILSMCSIEQARKRLNQVEFEVAQEYGLKSITERLAEHSPMMFAQLRDSMKARLRLDHQRKVIDGIPKHNQTPLFQEIRAAQLSGQAGEAGELQAGLLASGEDTWPD